MVVGGPGLWPIEAVLDAAGLQQPLGPAGILIIKGAYANQCIDNQAVFAPHI